MASRPPPLTVPVVMLVALVGAGGASTIQGRLNNLSCYSEQTCRAVCEYGNAFLKSECRRCHPGLCPEGESSR